MQYSSDVEAIDAIAKSYKALSAEVGKVIVGQQDVIQASIISLFPMAIVYWWGFLVWQKPF